MIPDQTSSVNAIYSIIFYIFLPMKEIIVAIRRFLKDRFNLNEDKAEEQEIVENIKRDVHFKGANLWALIFAIMIASIGLNVNSTAVIIGAMLISPIMGPIMGIGLGVAINDFELLKKGIKNLTIAAVISILTSAFYFYVTPLHDVNSELLARTNPSLWDVFIAFFGGLAGIVAGTRTQKSNVLPGVAIATALMPPLCTAGYGLATGTWFYLLGALYLFFINSLFICLATFLIVKQLKFHKQQFQNRAVQKRVIRYIWLIVTITVLPSIYLAYRIVERSIFEGNAKKYVQEEFRFPKTQVVNRNYKLDGNGKSIELLVIGQELSQHTIDSLCKRMPIYHLDSTTKLIVHQGLNAKQEIDIAQIRTSILEDVFKKEKQADTVAAPVRKIDLPIPNLSAELKSLYPEMVNYSLSQSVVYHLDSAKNDTLTLLTAKFKKPFRKDERIKLQNWMKERLRSNAVKVFIE